MVINPAGYLFLDQKRKLGIVKRIQKQIDKFGLTNEDVVFATVWFCVRYENVSQKHKMAPHLKWKWQNL